MAELIENSETEIQYCEREDDTWISVRRKGNKIIIVKDSPSDSPCLTVPQATKIANRILQWCRQIKRKKP